eukprot:gene24207-9806_t
MLQMGLALFSCINLMICWWELGLFFNRKLIKEQHNAFRKKYEKPAMPEPMFGFVEVPVKEALTLKFWSLVWSTYSLMDPSYQDQTTFGFFVDVGNGFTTLLPTLLWALAMTWDVPGLSARTLGAIGLVLYYQEGYGTVIYFFSYLLNERYKNQHAWQIWLVIISNSVWIIFPFIGFYTSYGLIWSDSFSVFRV